MKRKKMYTFIIATILTMSFIVTYDINESKNQKIYADEETLKALSASIAALEKPLWSVKHDREKKSVDYETKVVLNEEKFEGQQKVIQEGSIGEKEVVYEEIYQSGRLFSREIEEEKICREPVNKIVEKGTKKQLVTSRGSMRYANELVMTATAYDLSFESTGKNPGDPAWGITASGTKARPGTVAVDPKVIPLGTKLYVASVDGSTDYGFATAEDIGGAIKGNKIDLFMQDSQNVYEFGRRKVKVYILN